MNSRERLSGEAGNRLTERERETECAFWRERQCEMGFKWACLYSIMKGINCLFVIITAMLMVPLLYRHQRRGKSVDNGTDTELANSVFGRNGGPPI